MSFSRIPAENSEINVWFCWVQVPLGWIITYVDPFLSSELKSFNLVVALIGFSPRPLDVSASATFGARLTTFHFLSGVCSPLLSVEPINQLWYLCSATTLLSECQVSPPVSFPVVLNQICCCARKISVLSNLGSRGCTVPLTKDFLSHQIVFMWGKLHGIIFANIIKVLLGRCYVRLG